MTLVFMEREYSSPEEPHLGIVHMVEVSCVDEAHCWNLMMISLMFWFHWGDLWDIFRVRVTNCPLSHLPLPLRGASVTPRPVTWCPGRS